MTKKKSYLTNDGSYDKNPESTKEYVIKRELMLEDYKSSRKNNVKVLKSQQRCKSCIKIVLRLH